MASNNTTVPNLCNNPEWFPAASSAAFFLFYNIILPFCAVFGLVGHGLFITVVRAEAKKNKAYRYQLFSLISETAETLMFVLNTISRILSGLFMNTGWLTYRKVYVLMVYSAHISIPLLDASLSITLLLAICSAADRVFVLTRPVAYQKLNHSRYQQAALILSIIIGLVMNCDNCFLYRLVYDETTGLYTAINNEELGKNRAIVMWGLVGHAIRIAAVLILIACNLIIICQFHKRFGKAAVTSSRDKNELKKRRAEKTLILLNVCESCFFTWSTVAFVGFFLTAVVVPDFAKCKGPFFGSLMNASLMVASTADFYTALIISKHFRTMVTNAMSRLRGKNRVAATTQGELSFRAGTLAGTGPNDHRRSTMAAF